MIFFEDPLITHGLIVRFRPNSYLPTVHRTLTVAPRDGSLRPVTVERRGQSKYLVGSRTLRRLETAMRFKILQELQRQLDTLSTGRDPKPVSAAVQKWLRLQGLDLDVHPGDNLEQLRRRERGGPHFVSSREFRGDIAVARLPGANYPLTPDAYWPIKERRNASLRYPLPWLGEATPRTLRMPACQVMPARATSVRTMTFDTANKSLSPKPTLAGSVGLLSTMVPSTYQDIYAAYRLYPTDTSSPPPPSQ